jgi:hypothetical protein
MLLTPDANQIREYSLPDDKEPKTIFLIGSIDAALIAQISDTTFTKKNIDVHTRCLLLTQFGLKGWKNFGDEFDESKYISDINVPGIGIRKALNADALELVKPYTIAIGNEIFRLNYLAPDKLKNLNTPSR